MENPKILEVTYKNRLNAERRKTIHKNLDLALDCARETDEDEIALISITCILKRGTNYSAATLNMISSSTTLNEISSFATLQLIKLSEDWRTATAPLEYYSKEGTKE